MDILVQVLIKKYSNERTLIQEQTLGENNPLLKLRMTYNYVTLLHELVLAFSLIRQSYGCRVALCRLHTKLACFNSLRSTFNSFINIL
jgi:hypothetical protein